MSRSYKKQILGLFLLTTTMFLISACGTSSTTSTKLAPSSSELKVNDTIKIPIRVENISNLTALECHLSFDPKKLEVVAINDGGFLKANFPVQNTFDNDTGTLDYAIAQISGTPANGNGTLFEIVFRAKASGTTQIRFRSTPASPIGLLLSDSNGSAIQTSLVDVSLNIH